MLQTNLICPPLTGTGFCLASPETPPGGPTLLPAAAPCLPCGVSTSSIQIPSGLGSGGIRSSWGPAHARHFTFLFLSCLWWGLWVCKGSPGSQACVGRPLVSANLAAATCLLSRKQRLCIAALQPAVPAQGRRRQELPVSRRRVQQCPPVRGPDVRVPSWLPAEEPHVCQRRCVPVFLFCPSSPLDVSLMPWCLGLLKMPKIDNKIL